MESKKASDAERLVQSMLLGRRWCAKREGENMDDMLRGRSRRRVFTIGTILSKIVAPTAVSACVFNDS